MRLSLLSVVMPAPSPSYLDQKKAPRWRGGPAMECKTPSGIATGGGGAYPCRTYQARASYTPMSRGFRTSCRCSFSARVAVNLSADKPWKGKPGSLSGTYGPPSRGAANALVPVLMTARPAITLIRQWSVAQRHMSVNDDARRSAGGFCPRAPSAATSVRRG